MYSSVLFYANHMMPLNFHLLLNRWNKTTQFGLTTCMKIHLNNRTLFFLHPKEMIFLFFVYFTSDIHTNIFHSKSYCVHQIHKKKPKENSHKNNIKKDKSFNTKMCKLILTTTKRKHQNTSLVGLFFLSDL